MAQNEIFFPVTSTGLGIEVDIETDGHQQGQQHVVVTWISPQGSVAADRRLQVGDEIVSINDIPVSGLSLIDVRTQIDAGRQTQRHTHDPDETVSVSLRHEAEGGLGIVLCGGDANERAIRIKHVIPNSSAALNGLECGQEVVSINGRLLAGTTADRATSILHIAKLRTSRGSVSSRPDGAVNIMVKPAKQICLVYIPSQITNTNTRLSVSNNNSRNNINTITNSRSSSRQNFYNTDSNINNNNNSNNNNNNRVRNHSGSDDYATSNTSASVFDHDNHEFTHLHEADVDAVNDLQSELRAVTIERDRLKQSLKAQKAKNESLKKSLATYEARADAARDMEHDYDEIITLLESEVSHLRSQLLAKPGEKDKLIVDYRRRCLVLGCQLNKAVEAKEVSDAVLKVLATFARNVRAMLRPPVMEKALHADRRLNARADGSLRHRPFDGPLPPRSDWAVGDACMAPVGLTLRAGTIVTMDLHPDFCTVRFSTNTTTGAVERRVSMSVLQPLDKSLFAVSSVREYDLDLDTEYKDVSNLSMNEQTILTEAETSLRRMRDMFDIDVLPFGWEEAFTPEGGRYFVNHITQSTSWSHPTTKIVPDDTAGISMRHPGSNEVQI